MLVSTTKEIASAPEGSGIVVDDSTVGELIVQQCIVYIHSEKLI